MKSNISSVGIIIYYLIKGNYSFNDKRNMIILKLIQKGIDLNISDEKVLNDIKTLEKDVEKRITWN